MTTYRSLIWCFVSAVRDAFGIDSTGPVNKVVTILYGFEMISIFPVTDLPDRLPTKE